VCEQRLKLILVLSLLWAADNFMIVNVHKTDDIVFHRHSVHSSSHPAITGIEKIVSVKLLGVNFFLIILSLMFIQKYFDCSHVKLTY